MMDDRKQSGDRRLRPWEVMCILSTVLTPFVRRRLAGALALVLVGAAFSGLCPVALKFIVDGLAGRHSGSAMSPVLLVGAYVAAMWLARTADECRALLFAGAEQRIFRKLSEQLFAHLMSLPLRFHLARHSGAVGQTLDNGLQGLGVILHHLVFTYLPVAVELATVLVVLSYLVAAPFVFLFCGALVLYLLVFVYSATVINTAARRASVARVDSAAVVMDGLINYESVKYFTAEAMVRERVATALRRTESEWVNFYASYAVTGLLTAVIFASFLGGTVLFAIEETRRHQMTIGDFVLVNTYMLQVVRPVETLGYAMQGVSHGLGMVEKMVQLFRQPIEAGPHASEARPMGQGSLECRNVCVSYSLGRPVLNDLSFRVAAGHTLGIVGSSGSGKSTIVRLLMRLLEPERGAVLIDGVPISIMSLDDLRRSIAVVPQDAALFDDTVGYNIALGRSGASKEDVENAARVAQLHDVIIGLPDGYNTVVGERGVRLSGGERQRVSIARAVLKAPKIYVFDEATSALDSRTEQEVLRSLRSLAGRNTTLLIAHRISTVVHADEIIVLESGRIVEQGTHEALLHRDGKYALMWRVQQNGAAAA